MALINIPDELYNQIREWHRLGDHDYFQTEVYRLRDDMALKAGVDIHKGRGHPARRKNFERSAIEDLGGRKQNLEGAILHGILEATTY